MVRILPEKCRIIVIGDGKIGKSCLLHRYVKGDFLADRQEYIRTVFEKYGAEIEIAIPGAPSPAAQKALAADWNKPTMTAREAEVLTAANQAFGMLFTQPYHHQHPNPSAVDNGEESTAAASRVTERVEITLCDTAGQEEYDAIRQIIYGEREEDDAAGGGGGMSNASSGTAGKNTRKQSVADRNRRPPTTPKGSSFGSAPNSGTRGPPIVIACFAWDNPESLTNVQLKWSRDLKKIEDSAVGQQFGSTTDNGRRPFVLVLCATKMDTRDTPPAAAVDGGSAAPPKQMCTWKDVLAVKRSIGADVFVPCSSLTGSGVGKVFEAGLQMWVSRAREAAASKNASERRGICEIM